MTKRKENGAQKAPAERPKPERENKKKGRREVEVEPTPFPESGQKRETRRGQLKLKKDAGGWK